MWGFPWVPEPPGDCPALALPQGLCLPRGSRIAHSATWHPPPHPSLDALCPFAPQTSWPHGPPWSHPGPPLKAQRPAALTPGGPRSKPQRSPGQEGGGAEELNIQKTKIMASGPITSWQIDGETVETVADFIFGRSGGEKGLRGSGAGTLGVPLGGTRRVGGLFPLFPHLFAMR